MLLGDTSAIVPARTFNGAYVIFDIIFLVFFVTMLVIKKKYLTLIWAIFGGLLSSNQQEDSHPLNEV